MKVIQKQIRAEEQQLEQKNQQYKDPTIANNQDDK